MSRSFDFLQYSLPAHPAEHYINAALPILKDIKEKFPTFYVRFRCPSEVLTLSGVRAFDTYYDLGEGASDEEIAGVKSLLKAHGILLLEENFEIYGEPNEEHRYSLIHTDALLQIPEQYGNIPAPGWSPPNFAAFDKDTDFFLWWFLWKEDIASRVWNSQDKILREWISNDNMAIHHLTFGVLLGYPGEAICSILYETEHDNDESNVMHADIAFATELEGAQPIYSYLKEVADNPHIKSHQRLWSDILTGVYAVMEPELIRFP